MINNKSGGHKEVLSILNDDNLKNAYANVLSRIDASDTLVAITVLKVKLC